MSNCYNGYIVNNNINEWYQDISPAARTSTNMTALKGAAGSIFSRLKVGKITISWCIVLVNIFESYIKKHNFVLTVIEVA